MATNTTLHFTTPGIDEKDAIRVVELLQSRLHAPNDLHLTLKHVHWNVVGPHFIAVHEMIDPQVDGGARMRRRPWPSGSPPSAARPRARPARWSPSGAGTSTASAAPPRRSTSARSTSSTGA